MASRTLLFYRPLSCVSVRNPEIVPLLFHNRWFGQDGLRKSLWLTVSHTVNLEHGAEIVESKYHTLLGLNFKITEENATRSVVLSLVGEIFYPATEVFANLQLDLSQPQHNCSITLSPVPLSPDGKPLIPNIPGLQSVIKGLLREPTTEWTYEVFWDVVSVWVGEQSRILPRRFDVILHVLCTMEIMKRVGHVTCSRDMGKAKIMELFGSQLPLD